MRWGSSLNPHNDLFTEIKQDKERRGRGSMASIKPSNTRSVSALLLPLLPFPWGHLILLYPICQHHCPHISFQPPKYWVSACLIEGNGPHENLRKIELEGGMLWVEHVCIHPMGGLHAAALLYLLLGSMCVSMCAF